MEALRDGVRAAVCLINPAWDWLKLADTRRDDDAENEVGCNEVRLPDAPGPPPCCVSIARMLLLIVLEEAVVIGSGNVSWPSISWGNGEAPFPTPFTITEVRRAVPIADEPRRANFSP